MYSSLILLSYAYAQRNLVMLSDPIFCRATLGSVGSGGLPSWQQRPCSFSRLFFLLLCSRATRYLSISLTAGAPYSLGGGLPPRAALGLLPSKSRLSSMCVYSMSRTPLTMAAR